MFNKFINKYKQYKKSNENKPEKICSCFNVNSNDIVNALNDGCITISDIRNKTKAGTSCGRCNASLERNVYKAKKQIKNNDSYNKI